MLLLAFGSTFVFLFTIFQLHSETVHMVRLGSNVISSNPDWLCYALNYTEGHIGEHDLDNYMEQAYQSIFSICFIDKLCLGISTRPNMAGIEHSLIG